jgi:hypothetical protein
VNEARRVVDAVAEELEALDVDCVAYHDDVSKTQSENLDRIVDFHNSQGPHDLDVSVHFNAYEVTDGERGTEVLYVSQDDLAASLSAAIAAAADLPDRGGKYNGSLAFLNGTAAPAVLIETVFVDARGDCTNYRERFTEIVDAIAGVISGEEDVMRPPVSRPPEQPPSDALFYAKGTCSWFGGPDDDGVASDEGLAFIYELEDAPHLFLSYQPTGTSGLARRLDPGVFYVACRWDYDQTPKDMLRNQTRKALVRGGGKEFLAYPADWGPHEEQTGRAADLSLALMEALGVATDDIVEVIYPAPADA